MNTLSEALIMIVDDNPQNLKILAALLNHFACELQICSSGKEALAALEVEVPDLILLDVMMPELDGYAVCEQIRQERDWQEIPILFLTAKSDTEDILKGFQIGGNDYVTKPFNEAILMARIKNLLDAKKARDALKIANQEMRSLVAQLAEASATDPLTGLLNRRAMTDRLNEEIGRYARHGHSFALIMADIDFFKKVNDQYGHDGGDHVLKSIAQRLRMHLRQEDVLARWGGEEFLILLPESDLQGAMVLADRLRRAICEQPFHYNNFDFIVTMTFGLTPYAPSMSLDKNIIVADQALYIGKQRGRNQVYVHAEEIK